MTKMQTHRFFRAVWRFNALVILAVGIIAMGVLVVTAFFAVGAMFREREVAVVNTDGQQGIRETLALGHATRITGHPWLLVAVESDQEYDRAYFSKSSSGAARNYGFISASEPPRWLYPHNRFLVVDSSQLPASEYLERDKPTAVVSFNVVQSDSDGDKRLTPTDLSHLVFAKPDGTGSRIVIENLRRVVSQEIIGEQVMVIYEGPSGYGKAVVSASDFSQVSHESFSLD